MVLMPLYWLWSLTLILSLGGRFIGRSIGLKFIVGYSYIITNMFTWILLWETLIQQTNIWTFIAPWSQWSGGLSWYWSVTIPQIGMLFIVNNVSMVIHAYAFHYLQQDPHLNRFIAWLTLFTASMNILILSQDLLVLVVGWEGIGLASFLLIGFWFTRAEAVMKALKAFLMNRFGDIFLLLGVWIIFHLTHTLHQTLLQYMLWDLHPFWLDITGICFLVAIIAKSGQIGLHTWLPTSMEGPTPVSALLHAATLVTAGIYLILYLYPLYHHSNWVTWVGSISAFYGASMALVQVDLKRLIAYSTISQIGYTITSAGLGEPGLALFHLMNHAFFKAYLFMGAGNIIHAVQDDQDIRTMGSLALFMPTTLAGFLMASGALVALPFTSGYWSKESILFHSHSTWSYIFLTMAAVGTWVYSLKSYIMVYLTKPQSNRILSAIDGHIIIQPIMGIASIISAYLWLNNIIHWNMVFPQDKGHQWMNWYTPWIVYIALPITYFYWSTSFQIIPFNSGLGRIWNIAQWVDQGLFKNFYILEKWRTWAAISDLSFWLHWFHIFSAIIIFVLFIFWIL